MTRFIGREAELAQLRGLLDRARLVTLTGPGGVGKTRLALRLADELRGSYADGAWHVELSGLRDTETLAHAVASALRLAGRAGGDQLDQLADHLADRHLLLVLDTCEHLVDGCAMLSEVLLRAAPRLSVIATSREPLEVIGEHILPVAPLPAPGEEGGSAALELFADRAAAVLPGYAATEGDRAAIARLCRRLDGIPLAIELAAARLRALSVEQIAERLDDRFRLLGGARASRGRHQTLRATIAWSHDLCTGPERLLWARLSVFPADFDLESAEEVCADPPPDEGAGPSPHAGPRAAAALPAADVLDVLRRLVDKSIVLHTPTGRYRLLGTIREYGLEELDRAGERAALARRHRDHYLALLERHDLGALGPGQAGALARIRLEHANLRAALDHATASGEDGPALRLADRMIYYWISNGLIGEACHWLGKAIARGGPATPDRARATAQCAVYAAMRGDLGEARPLLAAATGVAAEVGDPECAAFVEGCAGLVAVYAGDHRAARERFERALAVHDRVGHREVFTLQFISALAGTHCLDGAFGEAEELCARSLRISDETGDRWCRSYTLWTLGSLHLLRGDLDAARAALRECLEIRRSFGEEMGLAMALDLAAGCAARTGEPERAAVLLGATGRLWRVLRTDMAGPGYALLPATAGDLARRALGRERYEAARARGAALSLDEALAVALGEDGRGPGGLGSPGAPRPAPGAAPLTRREREIAALVAEGLSNREIAERLVIAKRTADSHVEHILAKLGFRSRTQIAAWVSAEDPDGD
ncbi:MULTISPECIES: tetratricopeptide repeat protein [Actinomadura]|uniref:Tetratricopeptide repeat protein n=1 Tax=Actinomadura yumaensis TaxID=111807 RepID=A0ABW2CBG0_9ACTN|nr:tetratricopeptide repeat protein [Actinomadura sp. J1-007]